MTMTLTRYIQTIRFAIWLGILLSGNVFGADDPGTILFNEVLKVADQCATNKSGTQVISCYVKASPKKCESVVLSHFVGLNAGQQYTPAWYFCVASCVDAGVWSRTFGECSRELK